MVCPLLGQNPVIESRDPPVLTLGHVRIRVAAAGLNFADSLLIAGHYQEKLTAPFIPGFELSGIVTEVAADVSTCKPGHRVLASVVGGAWAEEVVVPWKDVHVLPPHLDLIQAAGFPVAYGTSHLALVKAQLRAGETLVVHGAGSGVGLTAVEIGASLGATVIACAGSAEKLEIALAHGAAHGLDSRAENLRERIKALTDGMGADVAYDPVGGSAFDETLRSTRPGGRILVIGFASGQVPQIPANIVLVKNISVLGFSWNAYRKIDPELMRQSLETCIDLWAKGKLRPHVSHVAPLDQAVAAMELLKNRTATGKVVLQVADA